MTAVRVDDWKSMMSALGSVRDKATGLTFQRRTRLRRNTLDHLYAQHPLAARVVDRLPFDAFREGWEFGSIKGEGDPAELHTRLQDQLHVDEELAQAVRWSRLYGGSLAAMGIVDGRGPSEPVDWQRIQGLTRLVVVAADDAIPTHYDSMFGSETYRQILNYQLVGLTGSQPLLDIHHSRVIRFEPINIPLEARIRDGNANGWGPSVLERLFDSLGRYGSSLNHSVSMLYIASILFVQLNDYRKWMTNDEGRANMKAFLETFRQGLDVLGIAGLDAMDKMGTVSHTIPGIHEVIDRCKNDVAASAEMPREILFNESPAGLNAGQLSGPQEIWFALVSAFQQAVLTPALDRIIKVAFTAWRVPITSWKIVWKPLWTKSDEVTAATMKTLAETDAIYLTAGVLQPEPVYEHRIVQGRMGPIEVPDEEEEEQAPLALGGIRPEDVEAYNQATAPAAPEERPDLSQAIEIVKAVQAGEIPRDSGAALLASAGYSLALLGSAGLEPPMEEQPTVAPSGVPEPEDAVPVRDAAKRFGMSTRNLTNRINSGELDYWQIGSRKTVSLAAVQALATRHRLPPESVEQTPPEGTP